MERGCESCPERLQGHRAGQEEEMHGERPGDPYDVTYPPAAWQEADKGGGVTARSPQCLQDSAFFCKE